MDGSKLRSVKRSERETVVTLRLPRELHDRLKEAGGERGLTAQIRDRLEASFAGTPPSADDPKTAELLQAVASVARFGKQKIGRWHENPYAFAILKAAVD